MIHRSHPEAMRNISKGSYGLLLLLLSVHLFMSSSSLCHARSLRHGGVNAPRKPVAAPSSISSYQTLNGLGKDGRKPVTEPNESLRRIPPSRPNPTQNMSKLKFHQLSFSNGH
ncbi:unnamed protein product [Victoria cruziana]